MSKRIVFVAGSLNQGGAEFQLINLARLFKDNGHEVIIYSLTRHDFYKWFVDKHEIRTIFPSSSNKLISLLRLARLLRQVKPAIVISYLRVPVKAALFSIILSRIKCIFLASERTSLKLPRSDFYYFNLMRLCSILTVNSVSKFQYIQERFPFLRQKTHFIPNLIDLPEHPATSRAREHDTFQIVYVGRLSPEKNLIALIQAFKKVVPPPGKQVRLKLFGDGKDSSYLQLIRSEIGDNEDILLMGKTDAVAEVYKAADLLCLVSHYEGFSNVLSEGMSFGVPIIASNIAENAFLVEDGVNGFLVDPNDVEAIRNRIELFLHADDAVKSKLSNNNILKAKALFDLTSIYQQYCKLLHM